MASPFRWEVVLIRFSRFSYFYLGEWLFMRSNTIRAVSALLVLSAGAMLGGCAPTIRPSKLLLPKEVTCIDIPPRLEAHEIRGLLKFHWTTRIQPGPYVAEREDANGTYYRAPPGGIQILQDGTESKPANQFTHMDYDGGIWVPRDPSLPPRLYTYFSTQSAAVVRVPDGATCAAATFTEDPQTKGVSLGTFAAAGALGGATGAIVTRTTVHNSSMSYGQATGVGAAGGLLGGLIVAAIINNGVGKIVSQPLPKDPKFVATL